MKRVVLLVVIVAAITAVAIGVTFDREVPAPLAISGIPINKHPQEASPLTQQGEVAASVPATAPASLAGRRQIFRQLSASSDPKDAFAAYTLLRDCRNATAMEQRARLAKAGQLDDYDVKRFASGELQREVERNCSDLQPEDFHQRTELLQRAAAAGIRNAALWMINEGPFGDPSALITRPKDPLVLEWRQNTVQLLHVAAKKGDTGALASLADQYLTGTGIVLSIDAKAALTYRTALDMVYERKNGKELQDKTKAVSRIKARLAPQDIEDAVAAGKVLAASSL